MKSDTHVTRRKPKDTRAEAIAELVVSGLVPNVMTAARFSKFPFDDLDRPACLAKLQAAVGRVHEGDLRDPEALLTAQAMTLNTMFTNLADFATMAEHLDTHERYLRLALKAQAQCRATLEALAEIKNPPTVIARQANIAQGPQQVNNTVSIERRDAQPRTRRNQNTRMVRTLRG